MQRFRSVNTLFSFNFISSLHAKRNSSFRKVLADIQISTIFATAPALSTISEARKKIGSQVWSTLVRTLYFQFMEKHGKELQWRGMHVYAIDGSKTNVPRELLDLKYQKPTPTSHYPQALISALYDVIAQLPVNLQVCRHNSERKAAKAHIAYLKPNSLVLYDRLYFAKWLYELHLHKNIHAIFRLKSGLTKEIAAFMASAASDEVITCQGTTKEKTFQIRLIKIKIKDKIYAFGTTLLDQHKFPPSAIRDLYAKRWTIEEGFKFIKQELVLEKYHAKHICGVKQEIFINAILAFLTRILSETTATKRKLRYCNVHQGIAAQSILLHILPEYWRSGHISEALLRRVQQALQRFWVSAPPNRSFERRNRTPKSKAQRLRWKYKNQGKSHQNQICLALHP